MTSTGSQLRLKGGLRDHVAIARADHWFKNFFMLPGAALAYLLSPQAPIPESILNLLLGLLATSLIASANYTINEWLDAEFDRHHPTKRHRPAAARSLSGSMVWLQWLSLAAVGLALSMAIGVQFSVFAAALLIMGLVYNVEPVRTKDKAYLDVLSESINNPIRFMLGWSAIVSDVLPPSSIIVAYWMGGAYLMAVKRYAEFRFIGDPTRAGLVLLTVKQPDDTPFAASMMHEALRHPFAEMELALPLLQAEGTTSIGSERQAG